MISLSDLPGFFSRTFLTCSSQGFVFFSGSIYTFTSGFLSGLTGSITSDTDASWPQHDERILDLFTNAIMDPMPITTIETYPKYAPIVVAVESLIYATTPGIAPDSLNAKIEKLLTCCAPVYAPVKDVLLVGAHSRASAEPTEPTSAKAEPPI